MSQSWTSLGRFHAKAVVLGMSNINGIILRCLSSKMYPTILVLCRNICGEKPMATNPPNKMVWYGWL